MNSNFDFLNTSLEDERCCSIATRTDVDTWRFRLTNQRTWYSLVRANGRENLEHYIHLA
jgi:hypothetical protein